jgi:hypothetical protein
MGKLEVKMTIYYSFHEGGRFFKIETEVSRKELMREICANWQGNYSQVLGIKIHAVYIPGFSGAVRFDGYNGFYPDDTYDLLFKQDISVFDPDIHDSSDTFIKNIDAHASWIPKDII